MNTETLFTGRELTEAVGCTRKALRVYREHGLIAPVRDTGRRRYARHAFDRLRFIVSLRDLDVSLRTIRRLLAIREGDDRMAAPVAGQLVSEIEQLMAQAAEKAERIHQVRRDLAATRERLLECTQCEHGLDRCVECAGNGRLDVAGKVLLAGA